MPETIELIHEELLPQMQGKKMNSSIKARLMALKNTIKMYDKSIEACTPNESLKRSAQNQSAILHQEISNLLTSDLPSEEESPIKIETMPTKEEQEHADRAAKVSLPATASVAEIEAEEKRLNEVEEDRKKVAARAKRVGLAETSSLADVEAEEQKLEAAMQLTARALAVGLPANATLAEVESKETEAAGAGTSGKKEEKKEEKKEQKKEVSYDPFDTLTGG